MFWSDHHKTPILVFQKVNGLSLKCEMCSTKKVSTLDWFTPALLRRMGQSSRKLLWKETQFV